MEAILDEALTEEQQRAQEIEKSMPLSDHQR